MKNRLFPFRLKEEGSCSLARRVTVLIVMFGLCLLLHSLIMLIMTDKPFAAYAAIFKGAFSSPYQVSQTLLRSLPIMLIGLGMSISLRAGVLNLGGNGCLLAGGIGATVVGLYAGSLPPFIAITLTILAAMAFGAIWSGIAGILRAKLKISEIYVTVMLNYVMVYISTYLLEGVWQNVIKLNWTDTINPNTQWPTLFAGTPVHLGFALLVAVFAAVVYLNRTPLGFEIKAFGLNNKATLFKLKETDNQKIVMFVMLFAGAIAGLAGASQVCGYQYRFSLQINNDFGFTGIIAAKLGGLNPIGILCSSLLLGTLTSGATAMQVMTNVPDSIVDVLQGMLLVAAICADRVAMYRIVKVERGARV